MVDAMKQVLQLAADWAVTDDFFALGGHSLLAARLATMLGRDFDITLPLRSLFEAPTAQRLAAVVETMVRAGAPRREPIAHLAGRRSAPLTPMQERMRFVEELHPGRPVYNVPFAQRLKGRLDAALFEAALREIARRQPALRTAIGTDPQTQAWQAQIAADAKFDLPLIDLSHLAADQREAVLRERAQDMADAPIDIHQAPLFHAALFKLAEDDHAFVFVPHHLVWDGASFDVLQTELSAIYGALVSGADARPAAAGGGLRRLRAVVCATGSRSRRSRSSLADSGRRALPTRRRRRRLTTDMPRSGRHERPGRHALAAPADARPASSCARSRKRLDVTLNMLTLGVYVAMMSNVIDSPSVVIASARARAAKRRARTR